MAPYLSYFSIYIGVYFNSLVHCILRPKPSSSDSVLLSLLQRSVATRQAQSIPATRGKSVAASSSDYPGRVSLSFVLSFSRSYLLGPSLQLSTVSPNFPFLPLLLLPVSSFRCLLSCLSCLPSSISSLPPILLTPYLYLTSLPFFQDTSPHP